MIARRVGSVAELPRAVEGPAALTWWAMAGMMLTEFATLALVAFSYIYIWMGHRVSASGWPPQHTPRPALIVPIVNVVVMLVSIVPTWRAAQRARVHDLQGVIRNLVWQSALCVLAMVLRYVEFGALLVRWDSNAYGSVAWAVLVAHTFVAVTDVLDTIGLTLMFKFAKPEEKHFVDVTENSIFWYFVVAAWIPLFVMTFLGPYF